MAFVIMGIGVGCWMYAFVNHRWNNHRWISSAPFFWAGVAAVIAGIILAVQ